MFDPRDLQTLRPAILDLSIALGFVSVLAAFAMGLWRKKLNVNGKVRRRFTQILLQTKLIRSIAISPAAPRVSVVPLPSSLSSAAPM